MSVQAELFHPCPAGTCRSPVEDPRRPCDDCLAALGPWVREAPATLAADEFAAVSAAGDERARQVFAERRSAVPLWAVQRAPAPAPPPEKRKNQECWCCELPRTCTPDPDRPDRWICRSCLTLTTGA